jgi:DNA modification methylase
MTQAYSTLTIEDVAIDDLLPDPANPRRISDDQLEALTRSLQEFGFVQPVLARRETGTVIGGHQRLTAARRLGYKTVPVLWLDLSQEQARLLNLALNKISGTWDQELLGRLLTDLKPIEDLDLSFSGFSEDELGKLLKSLDVREKRDKVEAFDLKAALDAAQRHPVAKPGELWRLGDHLLLCGDSTKPDHVSRLFGDRQASLLATDPPYLVDYQGGNHPASKANQGKASKDKHWDDYHDPETSVEFYRKFLEIGLAHLKEHSAVYQWHASKRQRLVEEAWEAVGLLVHQTITWRKARGVLAHSHYLWQTEPCFYGWVEGKQPTKKPPSNQTNCWDVDQQGESDGVHPTQKPVELFLRPIEYHTEPNDICYEPFSGSGTQIIACERLGRRCFAMEQEPQFVDVARIRWEGFTGLKAELMGAA